MFHPPPKLVTEAGAGEEFLRFHRQMVRNFKWLVEYTPGLDARYRYEPWPTLPARLRELLDARLSPQETPPPVGFAAGAEVQIGTLVQSGTADELGSFIEATRTSNHAYRNLHNRGHGRINHYEQEFAPADPTQIDASMLFFDTSPLNDYFWRFHGWIDQRFAEWQQAHGEAVDQTPVEPTEHDHGMHASPGQLAEMLRDLRTRGAMRIPLE